jgi:RimJ/RimL family protein N-acetyltransferase
VHGFGPSVADRRWSVAAPLGLRYRVRGDRRSPRHPFDRFAPVPARAGRSAGVSGCDDRHVPAPFDAVPWPVRTPRLSLRPATPADLLPTWRFRQLDEVSRWLTRAPRTLADYRAHFESPAVLAKSLVVVLGDEVVGDLMLSVEDAWGQAEVAERAQGVQAELGWVLDPGHAGRGYGTEAVRALIGLCFTELGLRRVTASCFAVNEASWRLMERVGMRRESHTVRDSLHRSGEWMDGMGYAVLADEWAAERADGPASTR